MTTNVYMVKVFNEKAVLLNGAICPCFELVQESEDFNKASVIARQKRIEIFGDRCLSFAESTKAPYVSTRYGTIY